MRIKELKEKTEMELKTLLTEKRGALQKFRFGSASGKNKNTKEGREIKKDIARIMTLLKLKESKLI